MEKIAFLKKTLGVNFLKSDFFSFFKMFHLSLHSFIIWRWHLWHTHLSSSAWGQHRAVSSGNRSLAPPHGSSHLLDHRLLRHLRISKTLPQPSVYQPLLHPVQARLHTFLPVDWDMLSLLPLPNSWQIAPCSPSCKINSRLQCFWVAWVPKIGCT